VPPGPPARREPPLDAEVRGGSARAPRLLLPLALVSVVALALTRLVAHPVAQSLLALLTYVVLPLAVAYALMRRPGLPPLVIGERLRAARLRTVFGCVVLFEVGRLMVLPLLALATGLDPGEQPDNAVPDVQGGVELAVLAVLAVGIAPAAEEALFRGGMLRGLMSRMRFLPALLISSLAFGALHVIDADASGIVAFIDTATLGAVCAWLYRRTATLIAPITFHLLLNGLALLFVFVVEHAT